MSRKDNGIRWGAIALFEAFTLCVFVSLCIEGATSTQLLLAGATFLLVLLPKGMERLLHCWFALPLYLFCLLYAIGPMLGHCLNLYRTVPIWDKLLHTAGGIVFAVAGIFLFQKFGTSDRKNIWLTALFAVCFSMALSVIWEFYEYGSDLFFGTDMQDDTFITAIHSYYLGDGLEIVGTLDGIQSITVNDMQMPWQGYLDIGLHDTMVDMLVETLGALIAGVLFVIDGGKHPWIQFSDIKKGEKSTA